VRIAPGLPVSASWPEMRRSKAPGVPLARLGSSALPVASRYLVCDIRSLTIRVLGSEFRNPQPREADMAYRFMVVAVAALACVAFLEAWARAEDKGSVHEGHVVKTAPGKLTVSGADKKEHTHDVAKDAEITLDGKKAKLEDLKPHTHLKAT